MCFAQSRTEDGRILLALFDSRATPVASAVVTSTTVAPTVGHGASGLISSAGPYSPAPDHSVTIDSLAPPGASLTSDPRSDTPSTHPLTRAISTQAGNAGTSRSPIRIDLYDSCTPNIDLESQIGSGVGAVSTPKGPSTAPIAGDTFAGLGVNPRD